MDLELELTPTEAEAFQAALLSAFPKRGELAQLVYYRLGEDLQQLVTNDSYAWSTKAAKICEVHETRKARKGAALPNRCPDR